MKKASRFTKREDADTWRNRVVGKRLVTSDSSIADYTFDKQCARLASQAEKWQPRIYYSLPLREGLDKDLKFDVQPNSPLLRLPAEIRNHILELVLPPHVTSQETNDKTTDKYHKVTWMNTSAVIFCCKQLYLEGRAFALQTHTYPFENFPKKTMITDYGRPEDSCSYIWDLLNIYLDTETNVVWQVSYG